MRLVRQGDRIINLGYVVLAERDEARQTLTVHFATSPAGGASEQPQAVGRMSLRSGVLLSAWSVCIRPAAS
jgi:hypothetical protein